MNQSLIGKWESWVGWQFSSTGRVPGISGSVDRDQFTDGVFTSSSPLPTYDPPNIPENTYMVNQTVYTVKSGDTLSQIALDFGTTVSDILCLNPSIQNPNLIFPGEQITIRGSYTTKEGTTSVYTVKSGNTLWRNCTTIQYIC